jgi:hypothetical protein
LWINRRISAASSGEKVIRVSRLSIYFLLGEKRDAFREYLIQTR